MGAGCIQVLRAHDLLRLGSLVDAALTGIRESPTRCQVPQTRQTVVMALTSVWCGQRAIRCWPNLKGPCCGTFNRTLSPKPT